MMERPILHFPMVRIHDIAEEAREAAKTVSTQTLETTDPSAAAVSSPYYNLHLGPSSKKSSQTLPSLRMTSLKPATHQHQRRRRISMVSGSIRIPPEDNYGSTYVVVVVSMSLQREERYKEVSIDFAVDR